MRAGLKDWGRILRRQGREWTAGRAANCCGMSGSDWMYLFSSGVLFGERFSPVSLPFAMRH